MSNAQTLGQQINALAFGGFLRLGKVIPCGSLEARKLSSGAVVFYWRATLQGKTVRIVIGNYDSSAPPKSLQPTVKGYSIEAARRASESMAQQHVQNREGGGYSAIVAEKKQRATDAKAIAHEAKKHTLENLLNDYCDHLQAIGRSAHADARSIFRLHVVEAHPDQAAAPANLLTTEQVADMMRKLIEAGKGRTANKLRSYVRAAFQTAKAARSKASIPVHFKAYLVTSNPAADTEPDESQNKADKDPLSADDLRAFWQAIKSMEGMRGAALRLYLLTGGQRIEQLVRLKTAACNDESITLLDGKGRPGKPAREHTLPLIPAARKALDACQSVGEYALSTDKGVTHLAASTLSNWAKDAGEAIPGFRTKRIRSGIETALASLGVSQENRGRLQSHGISGVQARHYDGHDYMAEKRQALETLYRLLERKQITKVVPIRAA